MVESYYITSTRQILQVSSFVGFWLYKSKENGLILKTEGLKIRIQNKKR